MPLNYAVGKIPQELFSSSAKCDCICKTTLRQGSNLHFPNIHKINYLPYLRKPLKNSPLLTAKKDMFCSCCLPHFYFFLQTHGTVCTACNSWYHYNCAEFKRHIPQSWKCQYCMKKNRCTQLYYIITIDFSFKYVSNNKAFKLTCICNDYTDNSIHTYTYTKYN